MSKELEDYKDKVRMALSKFKSNIDYNDPNIICAMENFERQIELDKPKYQIEKIDFGGFM